MRNDPYWRPGYEVVERHGGTHPLEWVIFALLLVLLAGAAALIASRLLARRASTTAAVPVAAAGGEPLAILDLRYARGELSRDEYLQLRDDLRPAPPPAPAD